LVIIKYKNQLSDFVPDISKIGIEIDYVSSNNAYFFDPDPDNDFRIALYMQPES